MRIGLVPLDERPANVRYPKAIADIAGADIVLPPAEALGSRRSPGRHDRLAEWLGDVSPTLDALVVSIEQLGYGGLIPSRTTHDPVASVLTRLEVLRGIRGRGRGPIVYGFNLVTRVSNSRDGWEESPYWPELGPRLYRLSQTMDRASTDPLGKAEATALRAGLPGDAVGDWLRRRARNHTVNLAAIQLLAEGVLDRLVLSSDDTSPLGLPAREKRSLEEWAERLEVGDRLLMYPGADEVGSALTARAVNEHHGRVPRFAPCYAVPGGDEVTAAFEDGPVRMTIERQVRAIGGALSDACDDGATWLGVNPPLPGGPEWPPLPGTVPDPERSAALATLVEEARSRLRAGQPVAVADVAYPNGADPALIDLLRGQRWLLGLAAYGGWNTAGNTIGTVLAQASALGRGRGEGQVAANERFLLHRLMEDWGYQQTVRPRVRDWLVVEMGRPEPDEDGIAAAEAWIEPRLAPTIEDLDAFAGRWRIVPGSVRLPWGRTFEVDFDLEPAPEAQPAGSPEEPGT
ncbi:MAG: DUF4127 family protein [Chloroflexota bacterium]|nr:DUF4127 family protein [Chloroflexota bacterium]